MRLSTSSPAWLRLNTPAPETPFEIYDIMALACGRVKFCSGTTSLIPTSTAWLPGEHGHLIEDDAHLLRGMIWRLFLLRKELSILGPKKVVDKSIEISQNTSSSSQTPAFLVSSHAINEFDLRGISAIQQNNTQFSQTNVDGLSCRFFIRPSLQTSRLQES